MNFIMIGLLLREALDRLCVRLNIYLVVSITVCEIGYEGSGSVNISGLAIRSRCSASLLPSIPVSRRRR